MSLKAKDIKSYLEPSAISKLRTLELKARMVVEGFMVGLHKSPYHGFSVEFSQHRPYMQGDSIKNVDWKVYAKREKYFIKQYEEETNLISHIFVDSSKSMSYKGEGIISKFEYAITLAAALCYLMINQQDAVGLAVYSEKIQTYLPPKSNRLYLKTLLTALNNIKTDGSTSTSESLASVSDKIKRRGLTIIISDFFDEPTSIISALKQIHFKKNEVIVFQILDPLEVNFGFDKDAVFIDLESREELTTQPYQIQRAYKDAMNQYILNLKNNCLDLGIEYNLIDTQQSFDKALMNYFAKRTKLN